ncbi:hypothetical protein BH11MYX4_BH11MYX4_04240 [soil metagenome]
MIIKRLTLVLVPLTVLAVACAAPPPVAEEEEAQDTDPTAPAKATKKPTSDPPGKPAPTAPTCPYTGPPVDVSAFPACLDGGRCIPAKAIPPDQIEFTSRLAKCPDGFCVPEKIVASQNMALPKTCASIAGIEGRCTSLVFPDLAAQKDQLPQDTCDANERCAPCWDFLGKETGACRSVTCDAPKQPAKAFGTCCNTNGKTLGRCLPKASLPPAAASGLAQKECANAADLCIPEQEMDPKFVHPKCQASSLLGAYDGVCISNCVNKDFLTNLGTAQGNCSAESFCAPCKNPLTGAGTGAPGCAP